MKYSVKITLTLLLFASFSASIAFAQKSSDTATTRIGTPKESKSGWPATGNITQGTQGSASHALIQSKGGGPAIDISNSLGTPVYATFEGMAYSFDEARGEFDKTYGDLGNYVKIVPDSNPSAVVLFGHLQSVSVPNGTRVKIGDEVGRMGFSGYVIPPDVRGTHLHYEFRGLPMTPPYIPVAVVPATCGADCSPSFVP